MKRVARLLAAFAATSTFAACSFQHSSHSLLPTNPSGVASAAVVAASSPGNVSVSSSPSMTGVWASQSILAPSPSSCGNFQWSVSSQTATAISGTFSGVCAGGISIAGTASGQLVNGTTVPINVTGNASLPGFASCPFSLNGTGSIEDGATLLRIPYTGTTCLGPVSGTETLHRPSPSAPAPAPAPEAPAPAPDPGPQPPSAPASNDMLDLSQVQVYNSPVDIANWAVTTRITGVTMRPTNGVTLDFNNNWPMVTPPGWTGGIQYTVWAVVNVDGRWYTSGFIEMWQGRDGTGAPILSDFARNWAYDSRWGPMMGHQPQPGEQMGFFVSAGDARGFSGVTSVRERSNVVVVPLPAGDNGFFGF